MKDSDLYVQILRWAYNKGDKGFLWIDLEEKFLTTSDQKNWCSRVFRNNLSRSENLIDHNDITQNEKGHYYYYLTSKGISAAMQYLILEDARKGGERAEIIAILSIILGAFVGMIQICIDLNKCDFLF